MQVHVNEPTPRLNAHATSRPAHACADDTMHTHYPEVRPSAHTHPHTVLQKQGGVPAPRNPHTKHSNCVTMKSDCHGLPGESTAAAHSHTKNSTTALTSQRMLVVLSRMSSNGFLSAQGPQFESATPKPPQRRKPHSCTNQKNMEFV
jgi:hypothetical protein